MPNSVIQSYAKKTGKSQKELEKKWKKAEEITKGKFGDYKNHYGYVMGVFKKMCNVNESFIYKVIKYL